MWTPWSSACAIPTWRLTKSGYDPSGYAKDGNRFLCANGYMGVRGTVEEAGKEQFPAITLAGVYDQYRRTKGDLKDTVIGRTSFDHK